MKIRKVILTATTRCIYSTGDILNFIFWNWILKCVIIYHNEYNNVRWVAAVGFLYFANDATWICKILNLYYIRIFMEVHVLFKWFKCICWMKSNTYYTYQVCSHYDWSDLRPLEWSTFWNDIWTEGSTCFSDHLLSVCLSLRLPVNLFNFFLLFLYKSRPNLTKLGAKILMGRGF